MRMKGILLLILFFFSFKIYAQEITTEKTWQVGVIGGYQPFGVVYKSDQYSSTSGFIGGVSAQLNNVKKVSGLSLLIQPYWASFKRIHGGDGRRDIWTSGSINLPVLVRYTLGKGIVRPFLEAGLNGKFRISSKVKEEGTRCGEGCFTDAVYNNQSNLTQDPLGVVLGLGAEINLGTVTIPFSIRSNSGLGTYKTNNSYQDVGSYSDLKTRTIQIVTGISF